MTRPECCENSHPVLAESGAIVCGACRAPVPSVAELRDMLTTAERERDAARASRDVFEGDADRLAAQLDTLRERARAFLTAVDERTRPCCSCSDCAADMREVRDALRAAVGS